MKHTVALSPSIVLDTQVMRQEKTQAGDDYNYYSGYGKFQGMQKHFPNLTFSGYHTNSHLSLESFK